MECCVGVPALPPAPGHPAFLPRLPGQPLLLPTCLPYLSLRLSARPAALRRKPRTVPASLGRSGFEPRLHRRGATAMADNPYIKKVGLAQPATDLPLKRHGNHLILCGRRDVEDSGV